MTLGRYNPRLTRLRAIVRGAEPGLTVVDGDKLVVDLAEAGLTILELYLASDQASLTTSHPSLRSVVEPGNVWIIPAETAGRIAPTRHGHGVLAVVRRPLSRIEPVGIVLFLDRIQEPGNVGAAIRAAAAFGASGVVCSAGCADPFSPKAIRSSAGQSLLLPVAENARIATVANHFRAAGGAVIGTSASGGVPLAQFRPSLPLLLVFGNEGQGLLPEVEQECSELVSIPLAGGVESLNVAACCAVILASLAGVVASPILGVNCGGGNDPSP